MKLIEFVLLKNSRGFNRGCLGSSLLIERTKYALIGAHRG